MLECTNVLWKQVRFHGLPLHDADVLLRDLHRLPLRRVPIKQLMHTALHIGLRQQLAVYDSVYLALAIQTQSPLLTVDQPQSRAAAAEGVVLKPITDFLT